MGQAAATLTPPESNNFLLKKHNSTWKLQTPGRVMAIIRQSAFNFKVEVNMHCHTHIDVYLVPVYNTFMKATIDTIIAEVLSLSPQARAFVAEKLIESLDSEPEVTLSSAWREEVRKRCHAIDEGTVELLDAEDVFARGYAALG